MIDWKRERERAIERERDDVLERKEVNKGYLAKQNLALD